MESTFIRLTKLILLAGLFFFSACEKEEVNPPNTLNVNLTKVDFAKEGGIKEINIETDAENWTISNPAEWLELSATSGTEKRASITLTVNSRTTQARQDTLIVTAGNAPPVKVVVAQPSSEFIYALSADKSSINFERTGSAATFNITTDAPEWNISSEADWLTLSQSSGSEKNASINVTALENTGTSRTATITVSAAHAPSYSISVTQNGNLYPNYNTSPAEADASGMSSTALQLADKISLGWNLGNSLEAIGGETNWGNPKTTKALIDLVKQNGFNAIRIPTAWNQYLENSATAQIKTSWLNRVKEVVDYAIANDMYVIINIHWDGGWLENNITTAKQDEVNAKQKAFWEQIATYFRDYDEHLIFASANEPHVGNATEMAVLKSYHQTFIDAVRSTGGRNSYRNLVIQGPSTDIEKTNNLMTSLPTDWVPDCLMAEVHFYTPWNFAGLTRDESWGKMFYYWGSGNHSTTDPERNPSWGEEETVDALFALMKNQFVDKGIPVVLGEFGAIRRSNLTGEALSKHLESRAYYLSYVTRKAKENGLIPFYWDNGVTGNHGFALFNRNTNTVSDQQALNALTEGINQ